MEKSRKPIGQRCKMLPARLLKKKGGYKCTDKIYIEMFSEDIETNKEH
jgi:hypothetical protein